MNRTTVLEDPPAAVLFRGLPGRSTTSDLISGARSAEDGFRADEYGGSAARTNLRKAFLVMLYWPHFCK